MIAAGNKASGSRRMPNRAKLTNVVVGVRIFPGSERTNVVKLTRAIRDGVNSHVIILIAFRLADFVSATN